MKPERGYHITPDGRTQRLNRFRKGERILVLVGNPARFGVVVRRWVPWEQYQIRLDDGSMTSLWWNQMRRAAKQRPASQGAA